MTIKDFNEKDIIDLIKTHSHLKHKTFLNANKPDSNTLIINLSQNESIVLNPY